MNTSSRQTRSQTKQLNKVSRNTAIEELTIEFDAEQNDSKTSISVIPDRPPMIFTGLPRAEHGLLLRKHYSLQEHDLPVPSELQRAAPKAVSSTLVFAQHEAGTAVCIDPAGLLLTCSHCVAETADALDLEKVHWLVFSSGLIVAAKCTAWDPQRDLALLKITAVATDQSPPGSAAVRFPSVALADRPPPLDAKLVCIGHPGSEDLEAAKPGAKTGYDVLHVSTGAFRGYAEGQDLQDNSEIGALQHDCWTYWGHSGAPLLERESGRLVGLHSSWDDETGMRRGVALEAIQAFLGVHLK